MHVDNKNKDVLLRVEGLTQELDDITQQRKRNIILIWKNHEKDLC